MATTSTNDDDRERDARVKTNSSRESLALARAIACEFASIERELHESSNAMASAMKSSQSNTLDALDALVEASARACASCDATSRAFTRAVADARQTADVMHEVERARAGAARARARAEDLESIVDLYLRRRS